MQQPSSSSINDAVQDIAPVVLVIVDMLSDFESDELAPLYKGALAAARRIAALRERLAKKGIPTIYVNDNECRWRSDGVGLIEQVARSKRGRAIANVLAPGSNDYLLLKPKHSIFYATPLEVLLTYMRTDTLILTGLSGIQCILFSAMDAYVRDFKLYAPRDCIVSENKEDARVAEYVLRTRLNANTRRAGALRFTNGGREPVRRQR